MEKNSSNRNMINPSIKFIEYYFPKNRIDNQYIENKVLFENKALEPNTLAKIFGSETRYYSDNKDDVSDLAVNAALKIFEKINKNEIDLLIFSAASSDLIEPATSNIIQSKLGLSCPTFDVKNACNSFVNAMQIASTFISGGVYKKILIVNGEKLSEVINFYPKNHEHLKKCLSGYTLGDAGTAMLMEAGEERILGFQKFFTFGNYWEICTVKGGGSISFRNPESYYFEGDSYQLGLIFREKIRETILEFLKLSGKKLSEIDWFVHHQVSSKTSDYIADGLKLSKNKFINTFSQVGNIAASTIPYCLKIGDEQNKFKKGDLILILGLAAGISISYQIIEW